MKRGLIIKKLSHQNGSRLYLLSPSPFTVPLYFIGTLFHEIENQSVVIITLKNVSFDHCKDRIGSVQVYQIKGQPTSDISKRFLFIVCII